MATLVSPSDCKDSVDDPSKLGVEPADQQREGKQKKQPGEVESPDQQQRKGTRKQQPEVAMVEAEEKGKYRTENAKQKDLRFLSKLLLVAMVLVVWCSFSDPPVLVWRFSFLVCSYSFIWSRRLDATLSAATMLPVLFSGFMAALYLDTVVDHEIGLVMAHLNSHLAVVMLGYALAKDRQYKGLEVTPATAVPPKKLSDASVLLFLGRSYVAMVTVVCASTMVWVLLHRAEHPTEYLIIMTFGPMAFALFFWSMFLGVVLMRGVYVGKERLTLFGLQLIVVELLFLLSFATLGDVGAMIGMWIGILVWTGGFGYSLRVYNSLKDEEPFSLRAVRAATVKED